MIQTIKLDTSLFSVYGPAWSRDMYMEEHPYNRGPRDLHVSVQFGVYETYKPFSA